MTELSLLIYLTDIASTVNGWAIGFGVAFGIVLLALFIIAMAALDFGDKVPYGKPTKDINFLVINKKASCNAAYYSPILKEFQIPVTNVTATIPRNFSRR